MAIINPFLLSGPEQIEAYQKQRIADWENDKGKSRSDFDHYFESIKDQWGLDDYNETTLSINDLKEIEGIDAEVSQILHDTLKSNGVLNEHGYLNLKEANLNILDKVVEELTFLSDTQIDELQDLLKIIQQNKPIDYETYSKGMFTFLPSSDHLKAFTTTESESHNLWDRLNSNQIIDDYGILLFEPNSKELDDAVQNALSGINSNQKERVLLLLNKHPELSYFQYIENFKNSQSYNNESQNSDLPQVGIYASKEIDLQTIEGLTKEEINFIRSIALMEWNIMLISQKGAHKNRKKSAEKFKKEKKRDEVENQQYNAQIEAKYQQEFKNRLKSKKKEK